MKKLLILIAVLLLSFNVQADYQVSRSPDGPVIVNYQGLEMNLNSSLFRESILLNHPFLLTRTRPLPSCSR